MSMALPVWSQQARREREAELIFRGEQYARAVALYQRRQPGALPSDLDMLVEQRYLRRRYRDPMTRDGVFRILRRSEQAVPSVGGVAGEVGSAAPAGRRTPARPTGTARREASSVSSAAAAKRRCASTRAASATTSGSSPTKGRPTARTRAAERRRVIAGGRAPATSSEVQEPLAASKRRAGGGSGREGDAPDSGGARCGSVDQGRHDRVVKRGPDPEYRLVRARRMNAVREQRDVQPRRRIDPERRAGESGVADRGGGQAPSAGRGGQHRVPPERPRASGHLRLRRETGERRRRGDRLLPAPGPQQVAGERADPVNRPEEPGVARLPLPAPRRSRRAPRRAPGARAMHRTPSERCGGATPRAAGTGDRPRRGTGRVRRTAGRSEPPPSCRSG